LTIDIMGSTREVGNFGLEDKIVVVTGGGSGIGLAFCKLAAAQGSKILIGDLKLTPEAESFAKDTKNVVFAKCDVTKWADLQNLITVSEKEFGDVPDVYAPIAGVFEPTWSNFWNDTEDERYAQVDINVNHPIKLTRIGIRALLGKNKKGVVVITASTAGLGGNYNASLYCATKHAIVGFVKSMGEADQLEGIKVVAICPGVVMSPLWTDRDDNKMEQFGVGKTTEYMTPDDIGKSIVNLVTKGEYPGGTVLKRDIPGEEVVFEGGKGALNDPAGRRIGSYAPIQAILKKERGAAR